MNTSPPIVLGLDATEGFLSAALLHREDGPLAEMRVRRTKRNPVQLLALVDTLLVGQGLDKGAIGLCAVTRGPGSFTGVRMGLSVAEGLSMGLGVPVWPVGSLEALAANAHPSRDVLALLDAKRGEVYAGLYRLSAGARPEALLAPWVAPVEQVVASTLEKLRPVGDDLPLCIGSGALAYQLDQPGPRMMHRISAMVTAELALQAWRDDPTQSPPPADPVYLRQAVDSPS